MSDPASRPRGEAAVDGTVWRRSGSAAYVESDERVVVLDLDHLDHQPYVFEGSAAQIWACLDGDRTEVEIVADLAEAFGAPVEQVAPDVRAFIDRLADLSLILPGPGD
ncbi:PqqD family protein [Nocardioides cynanchi]|uniref:PqqD family protein n=1 Tax=Nocardioides cynanchi TaxID=2558918 RepID=UPI0012478587|nr:PqqD family protein [Nocardioides cynanchi]